MASRRKSKSRSRKSTSRSSKKKKPFGGYAISFAGRKETVEQVFGRANVAPSQMTKKLWNFIKAKRLARR
ncbi:MAG TPA: hypothetical protein VD689_00730 [Nitrosopumilaceae archaeon]|nr:hypothetical protein [Nitrososphaerota archaeon]HXV50633.1 hypothetical protein [Nitrosopumilaceae archaeon]